MVYVFHMLWERQLVMQVFVSQQKFTAGHILHTWGIHTYGVKFRHIFFRKTTYTSCDVSCFVEQLDLIYFSCAYDYYHHKQKKYTFQMAAPNKLTGTELCLHMDIVGVSFVFPASVEQEAVACCVGRM
jgi:hypothetical protein